MGCLVALVAMLSPRFAFVLVWLFSDRVEIAFDSNFVPFLGLIFLPWTTLLYTLAYAPRAGVSALGWAFVVIGFLCDLGSYGSGARSRQQRAAVA